MKAERGEKAVGEKSEASRSWFTRLKVRDHFCNINVQGERASAGVEAAASCLEELARTLNGGATLNNRLSV